MVRIGLIGCGTIGSRLAKTIQRDYKNVAQIIALHDYDLKQALLLRKQLRTHPPVVSLTVLIRKSQLILEAASVDAAVNVLHRGLAANRDVFLMSVGALIKDKRWNKLLAHSKSRIYIPSGAIAGLDGIKAMAKGSIRRLTLTTRKPPKALQGAPGLHNKQVDITGIKRAKVVFEGTVRQVIERFPRNANIAAAVALASQPFVRRLRVRIIADPAVTHNTHELQVDSDCSKFTCRVENMPSANPKTSELAIRSAISVFDRIFSPISIGT